MYQGSTNYVVAVNSKVVGLALGSNPTIVSYNASYGYPREV
jgi:hypothetical protein